MITIDELLDPTLLAEMIDEGYVRIQHHQIEPYAILNYSEKAQFEQRWNDVTLQTRGLIFNEETRELIARGFKKFFNWDDSSQPYPPPGSVLRMPKMDGSLGILYQDSDRKWNVATRGSFHSDQATMATAMLAIGQMAEIHDVKDLRPGYSYLVEIIYPENRIVVNYGDDHRLVLLDVLDNATGRSDLAEFDRVFWLDKVDRKLIPGGFSDQFVHDIPSGDEGFVVYWPARDYRVKMKAAEYLELHRMIFSLSERSVWERMGEGESVAQICEKLPDEFHTWVADVGERLLSARDLMVEEARREFERANIAAHNRKSFAAEALRSPLKSLLFMLYDGKDISEIVWKGLRPAGNQTWSTISEDVA